MSIFFSIFDFLDFLCEVIIEIFWDFFEIFWDYIPKSQNPKISIITSQRWVDDGNGKMREKTNDLTIYIILAYY